MAVYTDTLATRDASYWRRGRLQPEDTTLPDDLKLLSAKHVLNSGVLNRKMTATDIDVTRRDTSSRRHDNKSVVYVLRRRAAAVEPRRSVGTLPDDTMTSRSTSECIVVDERRQTRRDVDAQTEASFCMSRLSRLEGSLERKSDAACQTERKVFAKTRTVEPQTSHDDQPIGTSTTTDNIVNATQQQQQHEEREPNNIEPQTSVQSNTVVQVQSVQPGGRSKGVQRGLIARCRPIQVETPLRPVGVAIRNSDVIDVRVGKTDDVIKDARDVKSIDKPLGDRPVDTNVDDLKDLMFGMKREVDLLRNENFYLRQQLEYPAKPYGPLQTVNDSRFERLVSQNNDVISNSTFSPDGDTRSQHSKQSKAEHISVQPKSRLPRRTVTTHNNKQQQQQPRQQPNNK